MEHSFGKKALIGILILLAVLGLCAASAEIIDSGYCGGEGDGTNLSWTLDDQGMLTISGTGAMGDYSYDTVPWGHGIKTVVVHNGVTSIGSKAFYSCFYLADITLPDSITRIGENAFEGCAFTDMILPDGVGIIGDGAFTFCDALTNITIPDSVTSIGEFAFYHCSALSGITIPDSVISIGDSAFSGCSALTDITIPDSVKDLCDGVFQRCSNLEKVRLPAEMSYTMFDYLFSGCSKLISVEIPGDNDRYCSMDGVVFNKEGDRLLYYPDGRNGSYMTPDSVTSIGSDAFSGCTGLTDVTIPDSVTEIGLGAFSGCALTAVTLHRKVSKIYRGSFDENVLIRAPEGSYALKFARENGYESEALPFECLITVKIYGAGTAFASTDCAVEGTEVTLTAQPGEGYKFIEWKVESGAVSITDNKFIAGHADVTVIAVFDNGIKLEPLEPGNVIF